MLGSLLALAALSPTADARPPQRRPAVRHVRPSPRVSPRVVVRVGPWGVRYRPAPRPGYAWVAASIVRGVYVAGLWRPTAPPPTEDHTWVDGYWDGDVWMDGYWRIDEIDGMIWIDGDYDDSGAYDYGYWAGEDGAPVQAEALPADAVLALPYDSESEAAEPASAEPDAPVYPDDDEVEDVHHTPPEW